MGICTIYLTLEHRGVTTYIFKATYRQRISGRLVFTPEKHNKFVSAETIEKPVTLINVVWTPNKSDVEIHVNRQTNIEIASEKLPFKWKLFQDPKDKDDPDLNLDHFKR